MLRLQDQLASKDRLLKFHVSVSKKHKTDAGRVQRNPFADAVEDARGSVRREPLDNHRLQPNSDSQKHMLAGGSMKILHKGHRNSPKAMTTWSQRRHFEH